ncbi:hypothetical protein DYB37_000406 [Aphanomyces astaci]|uniref:FYVE-type domain-containing protein n=1 Tax=Aphanomyces astaci TaxID=112090 RepID=A0A3R7AAP3_APHAT|nr:hypothetical protein DYB35_002744 [Aphanomyces astaci]RHZ28762.1 hypothetical protein DYB37_000406 [Aphanomyces astaci]
MKNIINPMKDRTWSSENGHVHTVLGEPEQDQIRQLFMNNHLSDVVLHFPAPDNSRSSHHEHYDGASTSTSLPAHRLLLSLRSGAFRTAFRESSTSYTSTVLGDKRLRLPLKMVIQDTPYVIFKELLRYIYTGTWLRLPLGKKVASFEPCVPPSSLRVFDLSDASCDCDGPSREEALRLPDDQGVLPFVAALNSANDAIIRRVLVPASLSWVTLTSSVSVWFLLACASGNLLHCQILADMHHADVNEISAVESSDEFGKGQTPLHIASVVLVLLKMSEDRAMESKDIAAADDTSEPQRELDTDQPAFNIDADDYKSVSSTDYGSTPLHLAVGKASEAISIALVRAGAPVYVQDVAGRSVVNLAESTSQGVMVVPLLLNVRTPPPWVTDDTVLECLSCGEGFGMATRKHHCRHCGRIVCATCSTNRIPLPKFDQVPAARVCDICFDVLSFRKLM